MSTCAACPRKVLFEFDLHGYPVRIIGTPHGVNDVEWLNDGKWRRLRGETTNDVEWLHDGKWRRLRGETTAEAQMRGLLVSAKRSLVAIGDGLYCDPTSTYEEVLSICGGARRQAWDAARALKGVSLP